MQRLLVLEDDPPMGRVVMRSLARKQFDVVLAHSAALARAQVDPFEWGVFDINLEDGCGIDVARELIERGVLRRVIFFTGSMRDEEVSRARALGVVVDKADGLAPVLAELCRA